MYREITEKEFLLARTVRFTPDSPEVTGIRFETLEISREEARARLRNGVDPAWRPNPISQVMPLDFEAYGAIILPWVAFRGDRRYKAHGIVDADRDFELPVPPAPSLDRLYADFEVIETGSGLPTQARGPLDRFAQGADAVFVKCQPWDRTTPRTGESLPACSSPRIRLPSSRRVPSRGLYAIFPGGGEVHPPLERHLTDRYYA